jgi:hypothetical protein
MIRKPEQEMRRDFWRADAWAAARAEKPASWHTPYPENPLFSRIMVGFLLFASLLNGLVPLALCFAFFLGLAVVGNTLRRVLMYWSIRRYGPWREMSAEMRAVIENPSDLVARPERFAPMPRGFTSTDQNAPPRQTDWWRIALPLMFIGMGLLTARLVA